MLAFCSISFEILQMTTFKAGFFLPKFFVQVFWTHQQPLYTLQPFTNHRMAAGN
jgi:hypothetical protein